MPGPRPRRSLLGALPFHPQLIWSGEVMRFYDLMTPVGFDQETRMNVTSCFFFTPLSPSLLSVSLSFLPSFLLSSAAPPIAPLPKLRSPSLSLFLSFLLSYFLTHTISPLPALPHTRLCSYLPSISLTHSDLMVVVEARVCEGAVRCLSSLCVVCLRSGRSQGRTRSVVS